MLLLYFKIHSVQLIFIAVNTLAQTCYPELWQIVIKFERCTYAIDDVVSGGENVLLNVDERLYDYIELCLL